MKLDDSAFATVIANTPLVSIDLIIKNEHGEVLLGKRSNRPAMGYWFVFGGRIHKCEQSLDALKRIVKTELGINAADGKVLGIFDHIYDDNVFSISGLTTHYVVIGYQIEIQHDIPIVHDSQHLECKWWTIDSIMLSDVVHPNTKMYFSNDLSHGLR